MLIGEKEKGEGRKAAKKLRPRLPRRRPPRPFPGAAVGCRFRPMVTQSAQRRVLKSLALSCLTLALAGCSTDGESKATAPARPHGSVAAGAADKSVTLFNGKDLTGWKFKQQDGSEAWKVVSDAKLDPAEPKKLVGTGTGGSADGVLLRGPIEHGSDIYTDKSFGDIDLHVEFLVPKSSNSGVYLMGRYEVQVLDSFGKPDDKLGQGDVGAIYSAAKPSKNASKAPGEWQTFDISFQAPRFGADGKKTQNAKFLSVKLNGQEIQKDVEVKGPTGGQLHNDEQPTGPLLFQGDHGIVAYRNVRVTAKN
jgi:hypothetical protein